MFVEHRWSIRQFSSLLMITYWILSFRLSILDFSEQPFKWMMAYLRPWRRLSIWESPTEFKLKLSNGSQSYRALHFLESLALHFDCASLISGQLWQASIRSKNCFIRPILVQVSIFSNQQSESVDWAVRQFDSLSLSLSVQTTAWFAIALNHLRDIIWLN